MANEKTLNVAGTRGFVDGAAVEAPTACPRRDGYRVSVVQNAMVPPPTTPPRGGCSPPSTGRRSPVGHLHGGADY